MLDGVLSKVLYEIKVRQAMRASVFVLLLGFVEVLVVVLGLLSPHQSNLPWRRVCFAK
jgi:hypothetical protein